MKVILDTNVIASGIFFASGPPRQILEALYQGQFRNIVSVEIVNEYVETILDLLKKYPNKIAKSTLDSIISKSELSLVQSLPEAVCKDPKDDKFIACALTSETRLIVSGDRHLLDVNGYQEIQVLKPRQFFDAYLSK